jgi:hypothetical protein
MGIMACQKPEELLNIKKKLEPKILPKRWMMIESKEVSWQ